MFGQNPKRSSILGDGNNLYVKTIFKTIQGEGIFAGMPAIFVRLGGCNLACSFCDTEFEDFEEMSLDKILLSVSSLSLNSFLKKSIELVVISGGEPFRQPIELLCRNLLEMNYIVQIETNGTLYREIPSEISIVCSPKVNSLGRYFPLREDLLQHISAFKFLISSHMPEYSSVPELGQREYNIPVFVQPMDQYDEQLNKDNQNLAIQLAIEYGYNLSLQIHKILGID